MMKAISGIVVVLGVLFSSITTDAAVLGEARLRILEKDLLRALEARIHDRCSFAEKASDWYGLLQLERLLAEEVTDSIRAEETMRTKLSQERTFQNRRAYLLVVASTTLIIESNSRVVQCIQARRISITTPTPYLNVCQTNQGPLGCAGQFTGLYKSRCVRPITDPDQGSGTLTVSADGTVRLKLESSVFSSGGSDEVSGRMDLTGAVIIDESSPERKIRYDGRFTVKSDPGPSLTGAPRLSGGGTYVYDSNAVRCDGEFRLHEY